MIPSRAQDTLARVAASTERGLAAGIAPALEFVVYGMPGPQGSKKLVGRDGKGRGILVESSKKVKPWRAQVHIAAMPEVAVLGPVEAEMIFTLPKPRKIPKGRAPVPDRYPDVSKLARSTEDALVSAGAIEDDGRIVGYRGLWKRYPNEGKDALDQPGCVIRIWRLT